MTQLGKRLSPDKTREISDKISKQVRGIKLMAYLFPAPDTFDEQGRVIQRQTVTAPKDYVPQGRKVIDRKLAVNIATNVDNMRDLFGSERLKSLAPDEVDLYLAIIRFTIESWLDWEPEGLRYMIALEASMFYENAAEEDEKWSQAADYYRKALAYANLAPQLSALSVVYRYRMGECMTNQGQETEAREWYRQTINHFEELSTSGTLVATLPFFDEAVAANERANARITSTGE